ncbi:DNA polymerase III subunit delta' [Prauserella sp. PE36]|uniref:DNA polymerase III subunit delta n=1 Tax=Prauserella endophytica TaxID=1592324 RepID=A0ABY2S3A6_9PSEU|nr:MULTISPECIES: DNA polymerase III subunit delta' [Prauserella]PXY34280.1 DNA polymerase III subunit delta' [Prauserella coralliicola]RBM23044.1 DNA polymerase III subunit delta' [Prauserella sp. PE36]TKG70029.1 DNA polymerase III subunit delta' [Prauserella endophytica]
MTQPVWSQLVGQEPAVETLSAAASSAAALVAGETADAGAMTHAWLFTGPPGSGRSVAARTFAAALQCSLGLGCGGCTGCRTALAGTHADVRLVVPEGLSISVAEMRALVQAAARRPTTGRWQVVIIEDADRLTEGAANALLKAVEEPPERTVFLLCAPSDHPEDVSVTIRSRCRLVTLRTPPPEAIAQVLVERDGVDEAMARWAASVCGGHVGRARRLATDESARKRRDAVLRIPLGLRRPADVFVCADELIKTAEADATDESKARDEAEQDALRTAMGSGGTGKGVAAAKRAADAAVRQLEKRQKSRATRTQRDTLDLALVDLAGFYRDVLVTASGAGAALNHPDHAEQSRSAAEQWTPASALRRLEAVLACREAIEWNVKPRIAVEAMVTTLREG